MAPLHSLDDVINIYFINLAQRTDRLEHVQNELQAVGLSRASRFEAISLRDGAVGCSMSHLRLLQNASAKQLDHIMILEDDITFLDPDVFKRQINAFLQSRTDDDWDVLLLAGNNVAPCTKLDGDDSCVKITACQTTTGYLVNGRYIRTLQANFSTGISNLLRNPSKRTCFAIDRFWFSLQQQDKWFLLTPPTVVQYPNYSDIEHRSTNYVKQMQTINKPPRGQTSRPMSLQL
jgi:glycosyl transferase family 25